MIPNQELLDCETDMILSHFQREAPNEAFAHIYLACTSFRTGVRASDITQKGNYMPMSAVAAATPCYVLMEANRRIGPRVMPLSSGIECAAVYGFSDKGPYDKFRANSPAGDLTPYPLVKDYLRTEVDTAGSGLKLIVLEATGPHDSYVHAATLEAVLEAQEKRSSHVTATHHLTFDDIADGYRVVDSSATGHYALPSLSGKAG